MGRSRALCTAHIINNYCRISVQCATDNFRQFFGCFFHINPHFLSVDDGSDTPFNFFNTSSVISTAPAGTTRLCITMPIFFSFATAALCVSTIDWICFCLLCTKIILSCCASCTFFCISSSDNPACESVVNLFCISAFLSVISFWIAWIFAESCCTFCTSTTATLFALPHAETAAAAISNPMHANLRNIVFLIYPPACP